MGDIGCKEKVVWAGGHIARPEHVSGSPPLKQMIGDFFEG